VQRLRNYQLYSRVSVVGAGPSGADTDESDYRRKPMGCFNKLV
jgi:hypothetical protein